MIIRVNMINSIQSEMRANSTSVIINCDMTESQMRDALLSFLEYISDETWEIWKNEVEA